jgi:hypothetical protein
MKFFLIAISSIILAGCASNDIPVQRKFPVAPAILMEKCESLMKIEHNGKSVAITELLKTVVNNYALYYECSAKVDGWHDWYHGQKKIFESIKDPK